MRQPCTSEFRVRYAETDQMGVAYHANYLIWCEVGRTDYIRALGVTYAEMERQGVQLAVADAQLRFHAAARYDDLICVETRLTEVRSRRVAFGYSIYRVDEAGGTRERLVTASTSLIAITPAGRPVALPARFRDMLEGAMRADG